jgi:integrase
LILFFLAILRVSCIFGLTEIDDKRITGVSPAGNGAINMVTASTPTMRLANGGRPLPTRINFTVEGLARLTIPTEKPERWIFDTKVVGLAYRLLASGASAFYLYRRIGGRPTKVRLGGRELTVEQARRMAAKLNGEIAIGGDPMAVKRAIRKAETLQELFERYKSEHLDVRCSPRTIVSDESRFDTCLSDLAGRKVLAINETDVRALHLRIGRERGHITANRAVQLLRRLFNFSHTGHNPASKAVEMYRENSRERFVQPGELPKLFKALDSIETNATFRDFFYVCLFTGARRSNVASMRMEQVNLASATWTIPAESSKSHESMTIPLAAPVLDILRRRFGHPSGFIFPSAAAASGHIEEPKATWKNVLERAGLADLRLHDLRRTFGSFQAVLGSSLPVIGKSLGHRDTAATAVYSRLHLDPVRQSVASAVNAMLATKALPAPKKTKGAK